MPLVAVTAYLELGRPDLPRSPLSARSQAAPEDTDLPMLVARAEKHLAENPNDGRGWSVLGPIYLRLGRFADSAEAFRKTIALLGPTPERLTNLGEALISAGGGLVTEEARLAFQTARELDPNDPRPPFFLAVGLAQAGKHAEARAAFDAMIASAPEGAPFVRCGGVLSMTAITVTVTVSPEESNPSLAARFNTYVPAKVNCAVVSMAAAFPNVTVPGPLTFDHVDVSVPDGKPSSVTVPSTAADAG